MSQTLLKSYDLLSVKEKASNKHLMKKVKLMVEIIAEFIPSPIPEYNGRNRNEWKNNILKIANIGVENTTKYFTKSGLKN